MYCKINLKTAVRPTVTAANFISKENLKLNSFSEKRVFSFTYTVVFFHFFSFLFFLLTVFASHDLLFVSFAFLFVSL